ncbi:MAG TPA: c-type cytochrome [Kofleriaceae bacterium]|jgi:mono/diheme cytochrome c family protein/rhodanese-related sulfurtransferase|nr:c-type cytochrome [Kofleriaceae bacterium]
MRRALALLITLVASCQQATPAPAPAPAAKTEDHARGAKPYATYCAPCHADDLTGYKADHAPSLVNPTFLESAGDSFLIDAIGQGRPGTSMAAYSKAFGGPLDPTTIAEIAAWIRSHGAAPRELAPAPIGGDVARGQPLYEADCQKCHGNPQTRGEFISLSNPRFLASASDAFMNHAILYGRPSTPMIAWQSKLTAENIADVIAYVRSLQTSVAAQRLPPPTGKEPLFINPAGTPPKLVGHADPCPPRDPKCKQDPRFVPAADVAKAIAAGKKLVVIDARPASEWMLVHVAGAVSIPHADLTRLDEIPKDAWVIAYCACPHHLSGIVVDELQKRGYPHAFVLDEGINFWQRQSYPIVAAPGLAPPPAEPPKP